MEIEEKKIYKKEIEKFENSCEKITDLFLSKYFTNFD